AEQALLGSVEHRAARRAHGEIGLADDAQFVLNSARKQAGIAEIRLARAERLERDGRRVDQAELSQRGRPTDLADVDRVQIDRREIDRLAERDRDRTVEEPHAVGREVHVLDLEVAARARSAAPSTTTSAATEGEQADEHRR